MEISRFLDHPSFVRAAVDQITAVIRARSGKETRIALSGGTTPAAIFRQLATDPLLQQERVLFYQVDERYVPRTDDHSNYKLILDNLLEPAGLAIDRLVAFDPSLSIPEAILHYGNIITALGDPTFHLTLLGMGPDGHTASLFPSCIALDEETAQTAHTQTTEFDVLDRLTLTYAPILCSEKLLLLLSGSKKAPLLARFSETPVSAYPAFPAAKLKQHPRLTVFFADVK